MDISDSLSAGVSCFSFFSKPTAGCFDFVSCDKFLSCLSHAQPQASQTMVFSEGGLQRHPLGHLGGPQPAAEDLGLRPARLLARGPGDFEAPRAALRHFICFSRLVFLFWASPFLSFFGL